MNTSDLLVEALRAVDEAKVPDELRSIAFAKAIDLVAGITPIAPPKLDPPRQRGSSNPGEETSGIARIASKLGVAEEAVSQVYYPHDDELEVIVSPGRLATKSAPAAKQLALLVAAGRQAAGMDSEWTSLSEVRKVCEDYKKLDSSNFAQSIKEMENEFSFRGPSKKREVRLSRPGWDAAGALVRQLTGAAT